MNDELIRKLLQDYITGVLPESGKRELFELMEQPHNLHIVEAHMQDTFYNDQFETTANAELRTALQEYLSKKIQHSNTSRRILFRRLTAAASLLLAGLISFYFLMPSKHQPEPVAVVAPGKYKNDISPAQGAAVLVLANGRRIVLDSAKGAISTEGGATVVNLSGELSYQDALADAGEPVYNIVSTGKGSQYQLILADGTRVWLNSTSFLRFPTMFNANERVVELTGEAYFEVAPDASRPFHVRHNKMDVRVLGTHFNVNTYDNEPSMNTTLLKGKVQVNKTVLAPGEQLQIHRNGQLTVNQHPDILQVMAWKNGKFRFKNHDIREIMRQLSRWYDVDVQYEEINNDLFVANIHRNVPISKILQLLELTERIHFKIEGKKITVMK